MNFTLRDAERCLLSKFGIQMFQEIINAANFLGCGIYLGH
jgi:hypothetical protein